MADEVRRLDAVHSILTLATSIYGSGAVYSKQDFIEIRPGPKTYASSPMSHLQGHQSSSQPLRPECPVCRPLLRASPYRPDCPD